MLLLKRSLSNNCPHFTGVRGGQMSWWVSNTVNFLKGIKKHRRDNSYLLNKRWLSLLLWIPKWRRKVKRPGRSRPWYSRLPFSLVKCGHPHLFCRVVDGASGAKRERHVMLQSLSSINSRPQVHGTQCLENTTCQEFALPWILKNGHSRAWFSNEIPSISWIMLLAKGKRTPT